MKIANTSSHMNLDLNYRRVKTPSTMKRHTIFHYIVLTIMILAAAASLQAQAVPFSEAILSSKLPSPPYKTHERFSTFLAGDFRSKITLQNIRPDASITVVLELILERGHMPMSQVTVPPHSIASVDIDSFMRAHGYEDKQGTIVARFDFVTYGPLTTTVEAVDETHHLYMNFYGQSPEEYWSGTAFDAAIWAPDEDTQGFVSITNSANKQREITAVFSVNGDAEKKSVEVPARSTRILSIDDIVARSRRAGAGMHIEFAQSPGDILVDGQLYNKRTGFTKHIHFMDKALQYPTTTLRTHFLLLGVQPKEDGFPGVPFRSVAVMRNIDSSPVYVTPVIRFADGPSVRAISLNMIQLNVGESRIIDFSREQREGHLPTYLHHGSLELVPGSDSQHIVAELVNFNEKTGGYVVGSSLVSYPAKGTSSVWRVDGTYQTTVIVENIMPQQDEVTLRLFSDKGVYHKTFRISPNAFLTINMKSLQNTPDDSGNLLVGVSGLFSVAGNRGPASKLSFDKIVHSDDEADYVGLTPSPCDYVTAMGLYLEPSSVEGSWAVMLEYDWASGAIDNGPAAGALANSSYVQISNIGAGDIVSFSPPNDGQVYSAIISSPPIPAQSCAACSGDDFNPIPIVFQFQSEIAVTRVASLGTRSNCETKPLTGIKTCDIDVVIWCTPGTSPPDYQLKQVNDQVFPIFPPDFWDAHAACVRLIVFGTEGPWHCPGGLALPLFGNQNLGVCTKTN